MKRHLSISGVQLLTLVTSLVSQMLLALHIGPGSILDSYFSAFGFAAAMVGGLVVASTFLVPSYISLREQEKGYKAGICGGGEVLVAFAGFAAVLVLFGQLVLSTLQTRLLSADLTDHLVLLTLLGWIAAFLTVITSTLTAIGVAHRVIFLPMVLGMLPTVFVAAYLLCVHTPSIVATASASVCGILIQAGLLAWILRSHWTLKGVERSMIGRVMRGIPIAAMGAICFSGYAAVDSVLGLHLGDGVLSHQAIGQRLVIAYGSVLSAGPFLLAPTELRSLVSSGRWGEIKRYVALSSLGMIAMTALASVLMPSIGTFIIKSLFQHGKFSPGDTAAVSSIVSILLLGAGPMLGTAIVFRALHTLRRSHDVAIISISWFVAYGSLSTLFAKFLGEMSLAISYLISWVFAFLAAYTFLYRSLDQVDRAQELSAGPQI